MLVIDCAFSLSVPLFHWLTWSYPPFSFVLPDAGMESVPGKTVHIPCQTKVVSKVDNLAAEEGRGNQPFCPFESWVS